MNFLKKILSIFKSNRVKPKHVKAGDRINLYWTRFVGGRGNVECLSNDPKTKKMLIRVQWSNFEEAGCEEYEEFVWSYKSSHFDDFHLLNQHTIKPIDKDDSDNLKELELHLKQAIDKEDYILARKIQDKIDKLKN